MSDAQTIYVELIDEGVTVNRPVEATRDPDGAFRLPDKAPADEVWRFEPGSRVVCELRDIGDAEPLTRRNSPCFIALEDGLSQCAGMCPDGA